jgi:uncharacterized repeat protein (TIGR03806 family)
MRVRTLAIGSLLAAFIAIITATAGADDPQEEHAEMNGLHSESPALPDHLSETGVFAELASLTPRAGLVRYDINIPFWSDGASKTRWIEVPAGEKIAFSSDGAWKFPAGTLFVKHFDLESAASRSGKTQRLETRLLWCDADGAVHGGSYRWRADGSDADLVRTGRVEKITVENGSEPAAHWYFPGIEDCRKCHLPSVGGILGVNTRQLNRALESSDGGSVGQLAGWQRLGLLDGFDSSRVHDLPTLPQLDDDDAGIESRARAYLDANCGFCHRPGGAVADFDARFATPLAEQRLIGFRARINLGRDGAMIVAPNDPWRSMLLVRMQMAGETGMPPLAHQQIDDEGIRLLREWIESLPGDPTLAPPVIEKIASDKSSFRITLRHDDPHALVRYTLDGSTPKSTSPVYAEPIVISQPTTVRARVYRTGWNRSIAVYETFVTGR